ncbi:chemotaxis protein CheC [Microcoleus sp. FACHB-672]|uniref:chemotaxis protein CheC n=1 Tax=Microcoleus sp. FACHB-672 TaxID=2692825 RepID=UPI0016855E4C|nr:chemotaxis protein CheC [Microcoleus sp. FACHB-672]MBD2039673.1 chemotaxis protein CheC [Microcoleus sp. FACHB-672]
MNLTANQIDALQELVNIGVGQAAGVLNEMIESHIRLQIPFVKILLPVELQQQLEGRVNGQRISAVGLGFTGSFTGLAQLVFPADSADLLAAMLSGEELGTPDLDLVKIGTLSEVGNIVINGVMGSISNVLEQRLDYSLPTYTEGTVELLLNSGSLTSKAVVLLAQTRFIIERLHIEGDVILLFNVASFDALLAAIDRVVREP